MLQGKPSAQIGKAESGSTVGVAVGTYIFLRFELPSGASGFEVTSAEEAVRGADVIVTATGSREPVLFGEWLKPDAHVNAIGSVGPQSREIDTEAMKQAAVVVESREAANREAGEIIQSGTSIYAELGELLSRIKERPRGARGDCAGIRRDTRPHPADRSEDPKAAPVNRAGAPSSGAVRGPLNEKIERACLVLLEAGSSALIESRRRKPFGRWPSYPPVFSVWFLVRSLGSKDHSYCAKEDICVKPD